jgi:hypothetical protein
MIPDVAPNLAFFGTKFCTFHAEKLKTEIAKPKKYTNKTNSYILTASKIHFGKQLAIKIGKVITLSS